MDTDRYLARIGYDGPIEPTLDTLRAIHRAHLYAVPFENLDIGAAHPIVLAEAALYDKIVARRRGGFCYELNGLFALLLRALGFRVTLFAAGVFSDKRGSFGPTFDHLGLRVDLEQPWLADVGFGDSFLHPLALDTTEEQIDSGRAAPPVAATSEGVRQDRYRIIAADDARIMQRRNWASEWRDQCIASPSRRAPGRTSRRCATTTRPHPSRASPGVASARWRPPPGVSASPTIG